MAKGQRSFRDAFLKAGLVQANLPSAKSAESSSPAEDSGEPTRTANVEDFPLGILEWAAAGKTLLGEKRLVQALDRAIGEGTNRERDAFDRLIESALDKLPVGKAQELRTHLSPLGGHKGVPTFCGEARQVLEAIQSGALDLWITQQRDEATAADALKWPAIDEGEDFDAYRVRLDAWAADKPVNLLKRIKYDAYDIVRAEREKRERAKERQAAQIKAQLAVELKRGLAEAADFGEAFTRFVNWAKAASQTATAHPGLSLGTDEIAQGEVAKSAYPWSFYVRWNDLPWEERFSIYFPTPNSPPGEQDAKNMNDVCIFNLLLCRRIEAILPEVRRRWPLKTNQVHILNRGEQGGYVISPSGEVTRYFSDDALPKKSGVYTTEPNEAGWWNGAWCGSEVFWALDRLSRAEKGRVLINVTGYYGRHPNKNYPRLNWYLKAGGGHDSFDLPIWRPGELDGELVQRFEDIATLATHKVAVPEAAYWMDVKLGTTQAGRPRLEPDRRTDRSKKACLHWTSAQAMSQGRHGWSGSTSGAQATGEAVIASLRTSSRGGGLSAAGLLLWLEEGVMVPVGSGEGLAFDGKEVKRVAGGGTSAHDDPSRDE